MDKKIAIINSICLQRKGYTYIISKLNKRIKPDVVFTQYTGHAEKIAKQYLDYQVVIAVGGDGTIFETINNIDLERQVLSIIPIGSGNSLANDLGIKPSAQCIDVIEANRISSIDLIECEFKIRGENFKRYATATSGMGFVCAVANLANRYLKWSGGFSYPVAATVMLFAQRLNFAKMQIGNSGFEKIKFTNLIINNTKYAGGLCVFPEADCKDSALNMLCAKTNILTQHLWNLGVITKTHFYKPGIKKVVNKLKIILDSPLSLMLDGEIINSVESVSYSVASKKLKVLT